MTRMTDERLAEIERMLNSEPLWMHIYAHRFLDHLEELLQALKAERDAATFNMNHAIELDHRIEELEAEIERLKAKCQKWRRLCRLAEPYAPQGMAKPEWSGSIFTGLSALDNSERLALWIIKRGPQRMFFNFWNRPWHG